MRDTRNVGGERGAVGVGAALRETYYFDRDLKGAADTHKGRQADVFCPVDSPALHVPLARIARKHATPTVHFVAPQYWGWAPWRTRGYAKAIDTALTILPFEPAWFDTTDITTEHVGHPLLDALADTPTTHPNPDATDLVLLPGSRASVIDLNLPWMLERAAPLADSGATKIGRAHV